jgi:hypothetical protein
MDADSIRAEIAWIHGVLAGLANVAEPDLAVRAEILRQLQSRWELLERTTGADGKRQGEP